MSSSKFIKGTYLKDKYNDTIYIITHESPPIKMFGDTYIQVTEIMGDKPGKKWCYPESRGKKIGMSLDDVMVSEL